MTVRSFLDSNVLVYTDDGHSPRKQRSALDLAKSAVAEGWGVVSTQILQEYFYVVTSKIGIPTDVARAKIEIFGRPGLRKQHLGLHGHQGGGHDQKFRDDIQLQDAH